MHFTHGNPPESTCKSDFVHSTSDLKTQNRLTAFTRSLKLIFSPSREDTCKSTFLITPARDTWKGTAKAAVDQKGSGESAQQPGLKDRNSPSSAVSPRLPQGLGMGAGPARASPACGQQIVATSSWAEDWLLAQPVVPSPSSPTPPPPRRLRTATSSSLFSSSLVPSAKRRE